ncbi:hypothetical protein JXB41_05460 [Candidatus Woesearchaeota archaeon]|nr:hypothetical protein [Candidatus Woesearchaeota archaeon]
MEFLRYVLLLLLGFSGLIIGIILTYFTKEELPTGEKYFKILQSFLVIVILFTFFYYLNLDLYLTLLLFILSIIILKIIVLKFNIKNPSKIIYILFGFVFYLSGKTQGVNIAVSLIFLYGFPTGSLVGKEIIDKKIKKMDIIWRVAKEYIGYLIIGLILYFF